MKRKSSVKPFVPFSIPAVEERKSKFTISKADAKKKEKLPVQKEERIENISINGTKYYQIKENEKLHNGQVMETTSLIEMGEYLKPISMKYLRRNPGGEEIEKYEINFNDKSWEYPEDTYSISMIPFIFRSVVDQHIKGTEIHVWLSDFMIFQTKIYTAGKERIRVPLGDFSCVKVSMKPDISDILSSLPKLVARGIQPLMPEFSFWFWAENPYPLIKFEGVLGPIGSPKTVEEVMEYSNSLTK